MVFTSGRAGPEKTATHIMNASPIELSSPTRKPTCSRVGAKMFSTTLFLLNVRRDSRRNWGYHLPAAICVTEYWQSKKHSALPSLNKLCSALKGKNTHQVKWAMGYVVGEKLVGNHELAELNVSLWRANTWKLLQVVHKEGAPESFTLIITKHWGRECYHPSYPSENDCWIIRERSMTSELLKTFVITFSYSVAY